MSINQSTKGQRPLTSRNIRYTAYLLFASSLFSMHGCVDVIWNFFSSSQLLFIAAACIVPRSSSIRHLESVHCAAILFPINIRLRLRALQLVMRRPYRCSNYRGTDFWGIYDLTAQEFLQNQGPDLPNILRIIIRLSQVYRKIDSRRWFTRC